MTEVAILLTRVVSHEDDTAYYLEGHDTDEAYAAFGQDVDLDNLTIQFVKGFEGFYGTVWIHIMKDRSGNVVVYKGSKRLRSGPNNYLDRDLVKGDTLSLRCKIKEHGERDGVRQTVVQRPKVKKK